MVVTALFWMYNIRDVAHIMPGNSSVFMRICAYELVAGDTEDLCDLRRLYVGNEPFPALDTLNCVFVYVYSLYLQLFCRCAQ